jgi:hypothetical protein
MRNIFYQYSGAENRLTHALMTALDRDRTLLRAFLEQVAKTSPVQPKSAINISVQSIPGRPEELEGVSGVQRRGIPDAWLTSNEEWCLLIENKVQSQVDVDQLVRHRITANRLGFAEPQLLVLSVRSHRSALPKDIRLVDWPKLYLWLRSKADESRWAADVARYLELMEATLIEEGKLRSGTLTAFNGFPFDTTPFTYLEAKRLIGLATDELRRCTALINDLGIAPDLPGRPSITGSQDGRVWDFLQLESARGKANFTGNPHLTLGVLPQQVEAMVTIPHKVDRAILKRLQGLGFQGFHRVVADVLGRMGLLMSSCAGAEPRMRAVQRRYPSQKAIPFVDATIDFDLRTAVDGSHPVKLQPEWLAAVYAALVAKNSNFQVQIGVYFPYRTCTEVRNPAILDHIVSAWIACRPLLQAIGEH